TGSVVDVAHRAFGQAQDLQIILARIVILNERLLVEVKIGWSGATSAAQSQQQAAEADQLFESHFSLIPNPNVEREKIVETPRFFFWFEPSKWTPIRHDESLLSAQLGAPAVLRVIFCHRHHLCSRARTTKHRHHPGG